MVPPRPEGSVIAGKAWEVFLVGSLGGVVGFLGVGKIVEWSVVGWVSVVESLYVPWMLAWLYMHCTYVCTCVCVHEVGMSKLQSMHPHTPHVLFLRRQNHLFPLAPPLHQPLLRMLPLVLGSPPQRLDLLPFDLCRLLDVLRQVSVPSDAPDLWHMLVAFLKGSVVFELLALAGGFYATIAGGGVGAPEADVAVVGAGEEVGRVGGEFCGEDSGFGELVG
jgi:hypothetical protein